jgi:16S rRNA (cytosine1402-N4)-methyltransferase
MLTEVVDWLRATEGGMFVDCTVGLGGHTEAILQASPQSRVIGLDRDLESLQLANRRLDRFGDRFIGNHANFKELKPVLDSLAIVQPAGILADLGISSFQLSSEERGFSFQTEAPLDMRMDRSRGATASDLVNDLTEAELADLIFKYGEERGARRIARAIVRERSRQPVTSTIQLAQIVVRALNVKGRWRIHPATRTFQAFRIAVNGELEGLAEFVSVAAGYLQPSGRLAVISFHSLEDGIIKRAFRLAAGQCQCQPRRHAPGHQDYLDTLAGQTEVSPSDQQIGKIVCDRCGARKLVDILTRKPIQPSQDEVRRNPRARSARLRVCARLH